MARKAVGWFFSGLVMEVGLPLLAIVLLPKFFPDRSVPIQAYPQTQVYRPYAQTWQGEEPFQGNQHPTIASLPLISERYQATPDFSSGDTWQGSVASGPSHASAEQTSPNPQREAYVERTLDRASEKLIEQLGIMAQQHAEQILQPTR